MEIVDGLHQMKTPMPNPALPYVLPYAILGGEGVTLFDAGYGTPEATATLTTALAALDRKPADIERLIVSHAHPDHYGMTAWIREQSPQCQLVMLEREWEWIQDRWTDNDQWTRLSDGWLVKHGVPQDEVDEAQRAQSEGAPGTGPRGAGSPFQSIEPDVKLQDGEVIEFDGWSFRAVWTPGHTPGHLSLYERNRKLMFTGDHVLPHISPNVSLHADQEGTSPLSDFRASLRKAAEFDTVLALPAHEFSIRDLPARCHDLLRFHDQRLDEVRDAIDGGGSNARDISMRVHWNTGPFEDFNLFMKRAALGETLSHLQLLLDEERVRRSDDGERVVWMRA